MFSLDIVCSSPDRFTKEALGSDTTLHRLDIGKAGSLHYQTQVDLIRYALRARAYASRLMKQESYAGCLAFFGIPCGAVARSLGIPYIVALRGSDVPGYNPRFAVLDALVFRRLSRLIWRDARAVVANSQGLRDLALRTARGQDIGVIPNGVDTVLFSPAPQLPADGLELLCVARLIPRKGIGDILEALALLPSTVRLTVAGDGKDAATLAEQATLLGIGERVRFLGAVAHDRLPDLYRQASVFVLPSINEGMSNTVLEALASGLPVVLTDTGGTRELLQDGLNGFVTPMRNPAALAEILMRYVANPALLASQGAASRRIAEKFSWAATAEAYATLFERCFRTADRA